MRIKISDDERVTEALRAVNSTAQSHTYSYASALRVVAENAEKELADLGIPKNARQGARIVAQSGDKLPSAYKYVATTTTVTLERGASAWYLVAAHRSSLWPRLAPHRDLQLTVAQDALAVGKVRSRYSRPQPVAMVAL